MASSAALEDFPAPSMSPEERSIHLSFMREALAMAQCALATAETPVGCVVVCGDEIIGRGMNDTNQSGNGTRHAEFLALDDIFTRGLATCEADGYDTGEIRLLGNCTLYVTIEPCIMCASLLGQVGIRRVFFGAGNEKFGGTGGVLNVHRAHLPVGTESGGCRQRYDVSGGWLREEAIIMLRRFYVQENERAPEPREKGKRLLKLDVDPIGEKVQFR